VIPHSRGFTVQAQDYSVGFPVTNVSTASALSLVTIAGPRSDQIPVHYHALYHETFFIAKGALQLSVQNETRRLGPLDIASVPVNQNHSFKIIEPDTEVIGVVAPGGFPFYQFVSTPFKSQNNAPWSSYKEFNFTRLEEAVADRQYYDYNPTDFSLNFDILNGTTSPQIPWHNGANVLPNATVPYYIAGGWGPKYLHRKLGQVVALYMSTAESNGRLTLSTITMQATRFDGQEPQVPEYYDPAVAQVLRVLEGQLFVQINDATAMLSTGDTAVVPAGFKFKYWSKVALTRFYTAAAVVPGSEAVVKGQRLLGLAGQLVLHAEVWDSAIFPSIEE
jgi:quercetin dioxygenase-like cupin family protein